MEGDIYGMVEICKSIAPSRKQQATIDQRRRRNFYDYHLRPVPTKVVQDLLLRSNSVKPSNPSAISVSVNVNRQVDNNSQRNILPVLSENMNHPRRRSPSVSVTASPSKKSVEICRICYDIIGYESHLVFDVCKHPFHTSCLKKWFQKKKKRRGGKGQRKRVKSGKLSPARRNSRMNDRRLKSRGGKSQCPSCEISSPNALLYKTTELTELIRNTEGVTLIPRDNNQSPDTTGSQEVNGVDEYTMDEITSDASLDEEILL